METRKTHDHITANRYGYNKPKGTVVIVTVHGQAMLIFDI